MQKAPSSYMWQESQFTWTQANRKVTGCHKGPTTLGSWVGSGFKCFPWDPRSHLLCWPS